MKLVWDLDGVIRDLSGHIARVSKCSYPKKWQELYNGKSIYEIIDADLNLLITAPPTAYAKIIKKHYKDMEIWTSQPENWRDSTTKWIYNFFQGSEIEIRFLKCEEKQTRLKENPHIVLVEDTPNFKAYDRVILIDRPYNQEVKSCFRIYGPKHLNNLIEMMKESEND